MDADGPNPVDRLIVSLVALRQRLNDMHGSRHRFIRTSGRQADAAVTAFSRDGLISVTERVASLFATYEHVRQFQTSVFVTSIVIRKLIDEIERLHRSNDLIIMLGQLRTLVERFGHIHFLQKSVEAKLLSSNTNEETHETHPFLVTFAIDDVVKNALYGTTVKWNDIAIKELKDIDLKNDLGRNIRDELGRYFAKQVLDKIDMLNKTCPGTRAAYEILCDFSHPNIGDVFASTNHYIEYNDRFGVRHIVREIDLNIVRKSDANETSIRAIHAYQLVIGKVCLHIINLSDMCFDDFKKCKNIEKILEKHTAAYSRILLKKHRSLFKKKDECLCASGKPIFLCCGKGLLLRG